MKIDCDTSFTVSPAKDADNVAANSVYHGAVTCDATAEDTYIIKILPGESPKNYRFRVSFPQAEQEPNNIREESQQLERGLFIDARIDGDDSDWYRIPAQDRAKVSLHIEGRVSFEVFDTRTGSNGWIEVEKEKTLEVPASRDIFIRVAPSSVYRTAYTIGFDIP
jgi:hypothetical protein